MVRCVSKQSQCDPLQALGKIKALSRTECLFYVNVDIPGEKSLIIPSFFEFVDHCHKVVVPGSDRYGMG